VPARWPHARQVWPEATHDSSQHGRGLVVFSGSGVLTCAARGAPQQGESILQHTSCTCRQLSRASPGGSLQGAVSKCFIPNLARLAGAQALAGMHAEPHLQSLAAAAAAAAARGGAARACAGPMLGGVLRGGVGLLAGCRGPEEARVAEGIHALAARVAAEWRAETSARAAGAAPVAASSAPAAGAPGENDRRGDAAPDPSLSSGGGAAGGARDPAAQASGPEPGPDAGLGAAGDPALRPLAPRVWACDAPGGRFDLAVAAAWLRRAAPAPPLPGRAAAANPEFDTAAALRLEQSSAAAGGPAGDGRDSAGGARAELRAAAGAGMPEAAPGSPLGPPLKGGALATMLRRRLAAVNVQLVLDEPEGGDRARGRRRCAGPALQPGPRARRAGSGSRHCRRRAC